MLRDTTLDDRDHTFATDLVYGTVRTRSVGSTISCERTSSRPVRRLDPPVRATLRMGAYRLVQGAPARGGRRNGEGARCPVTEEVGFANGVLRGITRLGPPYPEPVSEAIALSYPDWLVERLTAELGGKAPANARLDEFFAYDKLLTDPAGTARTEWVNSAYNYSGRRPTTPTTSPTCCRRTPTSGRGSRGKTATIVRAAGGRCSPTARTG